MQIGAIPGKMESVWHEEVKAVVDTWSTYQVSLDEFKQAVTDKELLYAKAHGGKAWIVDSSQAKGVFPSDVQAFIASDVFKSFARDGIKYFITISSEVSAITNLNIKQFSAHAGPSGIQLLNLKSVADAKTWLKGK